MDYDTFSDKAHLAYKAIPDGFKKGVAGLTIRPERVPHPRFPSVYTMGQCMTEAYPSEWSGPETLRSVVVLYHGSFLALAEMDPAFDWEGELWETLTHELRHHLESLAGEAGLEGVDYAMEEAFHRYQAEEFDPFYYQHGSEIAPGLYQVEYDFFLEQLWDDEAFQLAHGIEFMWHGVKYRVPRPGNLGDVHYIWVDGVEVGAGELQLVLVRRRGLKENLRRASAGEPLELWESEAVAVTA